MKRTLTGLWRDPDFVKLWLGQTVSIFGTHITWVALALTAVTVLKATPGQMGWLAALGEGAVLVIGLFAGVWVDRLRRRPILVVTDVARALALCSVPIAVVSGTLSMAQLYVVAATVGALTVFFDIAHRSYLPTLVERDRLVEANGKLAASSSLGEIGGLALGGGLVQLLTAPIAILLDALSYLFSAVCIGLIGKKEPSPKPAAEQENIWREAMDGLRVVRHNPILRALALSGALDRFFGSFWAALYFLFLVRGLGLSAGFVGLSVAFGSGGALLGTLLVGPITRRFGVGTTILGVRLLQLPMGLLIPLAAGPKSVVIFLCLLAQFTDVLWPLRTINEISLRQAVIPHELQGRVNASMDFLTVGVAPFGAVVGGLLGGLIGMRVTLLLASLGGLLGLLCVFFSPIRGLRELPETS